MKTLVDILASSAQNDRKFRKNESCLSDKENQEKQKRGNSDKWNIKKEIIQLKMLMMETNEGAAANL